MSQISNRQLSPAKVTKKKKNEEEPLKNNKRSRKYQNENNFFQIEESKRIITISPISSQEKKSDDDYGFNHDDLEDLNELPSSAVHANKTQNWFSSAFNSVTSYFKLRI